VTQAELRALLADALAVWGMVGDAAPEGADGVAVRTEGGRCVVRPAGEGMRPVRWFVSTPAREAAGRGARAAASIVGVLAMVRGEVALGAGTGSR